MTAVILKFPAQKIGEGGGVQARRELRKEEEDQASAEGKMARDERAEFFGIS